MFGITIQSNRATCNTTTTTTTNNTNNTSNEAMKSSLTPLSSAPVPNSVQALPVQPISIHPPPQKLIPPWLKVLIAVSRNPLLASTVIGAIISLSGLRVFLSPSESKYVIGTGFISGTLSYLSQICIPAALFTNGVWMAGNKTWRSAKVLSQAGWIIAIKLIPLPILQLCCCRIIGLDTEASLCLVVLSVCPTATAAWVVSVGYGRGIEMVSVTTVIGLVLILPAVLVYLNVPGKMGIYPYVGPYSH
mmetsp:Transcript_31446/g.57111  ORF Transcript_31446/g.57111 Transcript_31446/m.57111 type:complete len:247 (-) Transcript_31446:22-762(-)